VSAQIEDGLEGARFLTVTFADPLKDGGGEEPVDLRFQNALFAGFGALPPEAAGSASNAVAAPTAFVDAAAGDYHLVAGAPPIDAGETLALVTHDRDGVLRPVGRAYDIGAYERFGREPTAPADGVGSDAGDATGGSGDADAEAGIPAGQNPGQPSGCGLGLRRAGQWAWLVAFLLAAGLAVRLRLRRSR
jgi:hypothetical protein